MVNIYNPVEFGLNGEILAVFPKAGSDSSKMYFLDTKTEPFSNKRKHVTLEISIESVNEIVTFGQDDPTKVVKFAIRPVFELPSIIKTEWFKMSADENWTVFVRESDHYFAVLQTDLNSPDYTT